MGFKEAWREAGEQQAAKVAERQAQLDATWRVEYKVVEVRSTLLGGKMVGDELEKLLNDHARQGWQLKAMTSVDVKGRIGPGGTEGMLLTFERPRS